MLLLIGFIIGLVLGLTGAGGSVFAVPLLMLLAGMPMGDAVGISLGAVAAATLYGTLSNWRSRKILWQPGLILALTGALTAPLGKWLGLQIPETLLLLGFNLLALAIALRMWLNATRAPALAGLVRAGRFAQEPVAGMLCNLSSNGQFQLRPGCLSGLMLGGSLVGLLSGLFGVGGGFLIIPLLLALSPITMAQAVGTSLVIIAAVSSSGFISHLAMNPTRDWLPIGLVAAGGIFGMIAGQLVSQKIANATLQKLFSVCLVAISLTTFVIYLRAHHDF